jgi:hypothetical protein
MTERGETEEGPEERKEKQGRKGKNKRKFVKKKNRKEAKEKHTRAEKLNGSGGPADAASGTGLIQARVGIP